MIARVAKTQRDPWHQVSQAAEQAVSGRGRSAGSRQSATLGAMAVRLPGLRTISARIVLGFALLILTFGGVSALTVYNMSLLGRDLRVIRLGYQPLANKTRELADIQDELSMYLRDIPSERSPTRVDARVKGALAARQRVLAEAEEIAAVLDNLPRSHPSAVRRIHADLAEFRRKADETRADYEALLAAPPVDRAGGPAPPTATVTPSAEALAAARSALDSLQKNERRSYGQIHVLARWLNDIVVDDTMYRLENNEGKVRTWTVYLGSTAVLVGLLVTIWATLTLRPLRRLRQAAQRIARGDYGSRIDESGPAEVAGLARDFNVMGHAIEERERELVRSERLAAVGKMAAMITHEVRNPLSSIGLNTELLQDELGALPDQAGAEARSLCQAITTEVDRLTSITDEYLHFARLPKPKLRLESLNPLIASLLAFEREQLALRGVRLASTLAEDLPMVAVDEAQIRQALLNLLRNAGDAVAEIGGGQVTVRTRCQNGATGTGPRVADEPACVEVVVEDDGPGIAPEIAAKVFEPFFSTKEGGTGLGLALTHQIVIEHGGQIRLESEPGHGTRFVLSFAVGARQTR
jgi:signal transduction histidine kinase